MAKKQELPPRNSWQEELDQLEQLVEQGRPDLIRQILVDKWTDADCDRQRRADAMLRAMDVACGKGPEHMIEVSFDRMLRTCLWLQIRMETSLEPTIRSHESGWGSLPTGPVPTQMVADIERLQRHLCFLAKTYASIKHVLNLSERSDEKNFKKVLKLVKEAEESSQSADMDVREAHVG